jgi:hypothetical protein
VEVVEGVEEVEEEVDVKELDYLMSFFGLPNP